MPGARRNNALGPTARAPQQVLFQRVGGRKIGLLLRQHLAERHRLFPFRPSAPGPHQRRRQDAAIADFHANHLVYSETALSIGPFNRRVYRGPIPKPGPRDPRPFRRIASPSGPGRRTMRSAEVVVPLLDKLRGFLDAQRTAEYRRPARPAVVSLIQTEVAHGW